MIDYREVPDSNIAEIVVDGPVGKQDYDAVCERLVALIERHGSIRLLEDIREIGHIDLSIIPADIAFAFHHLKEISHCAIVSQEEWLDWLAKALDPLLSCKVRYFKREELQAARDWLSQD